MGNGKGGTVISVFGDGYSVGEGVGAGDGCR